MIIIIIRLVDSSEFSGIMIDSSHYDNDRII